MEYQNLNRKFILNLVVAILVLVLIYGFIRLISPFIFAIFLTVIFSIIYYPFYEFLLKKNINKNIVSFLSVIAIFLTIVIPFVFFGWMLFKEAKLVYPQTISYLINLKEINIPLPSFIPLSSSELKEIIITNMEEIQKTILKSGFNVLKNVFFFFVNMFVMFFTMFFIFKDGKNLLSWLIDIIPLENRYIERILNQFSLTVNSIIKGVIFTAFIQGVVASIGYYIFGLKSPFLLGFMVMFSALVPFIGTSLITIPVAIYSYFTMDFYLFLFIALWGVLVVGMVDNFVRPFLIGRSARLPIALIFLGIIGGIKTYGPVGIFIGPIFVSIIITLLEIYKEKISIKKNSNC